MFMTLYVLSCIATLYLAFRYELSKPILLLVINLLLPFVGLIYTLYVVYVVRPELIAKATGQPLPQPFFVPYLEKLRSAILGLWGYLLGLIGKKPPRID